MSIYEETGLSKARNSKTIRLLELSTSEEEALQGTLIVTSLKSSWSFYALSYVWGSFSSPPHSINCRAANSDLRASVPITENCRDALVQIRHLYGKRWFSGSRIRIWVDAICINQNDEAEKAQQIPLMEAIYGKADRVILWLGKDTRSSDNAMDWISVESLKHSSLMGVRWQSFPRNMYPREQWRLLKNIPEILRREWRRRTQQHVRNPYPRHDMQDLFKRDWFSRCWTMQELAIASEPLVVCGSKTIAWSYLALVIVNARTQEEDDVHSRINELLGLITFLWSFWIDLLWKESFYKAPQRQWVEELPESWPRDVLETLLTILEQNSRVVIRAQAGAIASIMIWRLLHNLRPLDTLWLLLPTFLLGATLLLTPAATDEGWPQRQRDGIAKMLNLNRKRHATKPKDKVFALYGVLRAFGVPLEHPDYSGSLEEVYRMFTVKMTLWIGSLQFLIEAGESELANSPSWVPDWRKELQRPMGGRAASTSTPNFRFVEQGRGIETTAIMIGSVANLLLENLALRRQRSKPSAQSGTQGIVHPDDLADMIDWLHTVDTKEDFSVAAFEILHSVNEFLMYTPESLRTIFKHFYTTCIQKGEAYDIKLDECVAKIRNDHEMSRYFHRLVHSIASKRVFFRTDTGHFGAGPVSIQPGDSVALVAGLGCPLILRSTVGGRYRVIGAGYIHGMMYGEFWPESRDKLQEIVLI